MPPAVPARMDASASSGPPADARGLLDDDDRFCPWGGNDNVPEAVLDGVLATFERLIDSPADTNRLG